MADSPKKSTKKNAHADETAQQKLARLASKRVPKAVKAISAVGNLKTYKPTASQSKAILDALKSALNSIEHRLTSTETKQESSFALPS